MSKAKTYTRIIFWSLFIPAAIIAGWYFWQRGIIQQIDRNLKLMQHPNAKVASQAWWDLRQLYYTKTAPSGIWRMPVNGGEEAEVLTDPVDYFWNWTLTRSGIYFAARRSQGRKQELRILFFDIQSGEVTKVFRQQRRSRHDCLAVSPDEEWILFGQAPNVESELMLVENFR